MKAFREPRKPSAYQEAVSKSKLSINRDLLSPDERTCILQLRVLYHANAEAVISVLHQKCQDFQFAPAGSLLAKPEIDWNTSLLKRLDF